MGPNWNAVAFAIGGVVLLVVVLLGIGALVVIVTWSWVVPDVFAGAVAQNILPASLSFWQALKLMILFGVLGLTGFAAKAKR